jgi:hypothetical protein
MDHTEGGKVWTGRFISTLSLLHRDNKYPFRGRTAKETPLQRSFAHGKGTPVTPLILRLFCLNHIKGGPFPYRRRFRGFPQFLSWTRFIIFVKNSDNICFN